MADQLERLVRMAFARWKSGQPRASVHPDEETFSLAMQGKLTHGEQAAFEEHLAACDACAETAGVFLQAAQAETADVPAEILARAQGLAAGAGRAGAVEDVFEVAIRLKDALIELVRSSGDVLIGQEYIPAAVLRSREQFEFTGAFTIVKDCAVFRCQIGIERAAAAQLRLRVAVFDRQSARPVSDVRFTLSARGVELESRFADNGAIVFEAVPAGVYTISVEDSTGRVAKIHLEALA